MRRAIAVAAVFVLGLAAGWVLRGERRPPSAPPDHDPCPAGSVVTLIRNADGDPDQHVVTLEVWREWGADGKPTELGAEPAGGESWEIILPTPRGPRHLIGKTVVRPPSPPATP